MVTKPPTAIWSGMKIARLSAFNAVTPGRSVRSGPRQVQHETAFSLAALYVERGGMNWKTHTSTTCIAGCFTCNGSNYIWDTKNAMALAAKPHDKTGHSTWAD